MSVAIPIPLLQHLPDVNVTPAVGVDEYALTYDHDTAKFVLRAPAAAPDLSGYALLAGRAGGQTLYGGTAANDDITIHGTSDGTRTTSYVLLQPTAGNVGIGTTSPGSKLQVNKADANAILALSGASGSFANIGLGRTAQEVTLAIAGDANQFATGAVAGDAILRVDSASRKVFLSAGSSPTMTITSANVGIGTTAPATALHVVGAATITAGIRPAADSTTALQLQNASGTSVLNVDTTNGRVGIGTVVPAEELDVVGDIGLTGNIIDRGGASADIRLGGTDDTRYLRLTTSSVGASLRGFGGSANNLALGSGTAGDIITLLSTGLAGIGTTTPETKLHTLLISASTNAVTNVLIIGHDTSGTAAAGFGAGQLFNLESSTTAAQSAARIQALWYEATHATRKADLVLTSYDSGGEREGLRIRGDGSGPAIGFYGVAPIARAILATGAGATADNIITALQNLGLVKQS